jgi:hypothetical protein
MREGHQYYTKRNKPTADEIQSYRDFTDFCKHLGTAEFVHRDLHIRPQLSWMRNKQGQIFVDYVGRYETLLHRDLHAIAQRIGYNDHFDLPIVNNSKHDSYTVYYNQETRQIVYEFFREDVEMLGYSFHGFKPTGLIKETRFATEH